MSFTLVIDTSLNACTTALFDGDRVLAQSTDAMARGHQERLGVAVAELFDAAGISPSQLGLIGVTLGPGSFTGLRVGLSFAKGLGVGLGIRPKGIGTLEALGHHPHLRGQRRMTVIDGGRGQIYAQVFGVDGEGVFDAGSPLALSASSDFTPFRDIAVLTGPGAGLVHGHLPQAELFAQDWPVADALNRLARAPGHDALEPLYMRDADAKVSTRGVIAPLEGAVGA